MSSFRIINTFDRAASNYDAAATAQARIAKRLVEWTNETCTRPAAILDLGAGTGFVSEVAHAFWPNTQVTAVDSSAAMLGEAKRKLPSLTTLQSNLETFESSQKYDLILSSMALHWMVDPLRALQRWSNWLTPQGKMFIALPVDGSFAEWSAYCTQNNLRNGLWRFPRENFAKNLAHRSFIEPMSITYSSALDFLRTIKRAGAATPHEQHQPNSTGSLRRGLRNPVQPFSVTYRLLFLEVQRSDP